MTFEGLLRKAILANRGELLKKLVDQTVKDLEEKGIASKAWKETLEALQNPEFDQEIFTKKVLDILVKHVDKDTLRKISDDMSDL